MKESSMLKIALAVAILGIVSLFVIAKNIEITDTTIEKINREEISGTVTVTGRITQIQAGEKFTSMVIAQESELEAIAYSMIDLNPGDIVRVTGKYEDNQLVIDKIELI